MKVLVLGATGYLGRPIAEALVRSGNLVYAQTRSADKAASLAAQEMVPVVSDPNSDNLFLDLISTSKVDVVVEVLNGFDPQLGAEVFTKVSEAAVKARNPAYKLTYIAISGCYVHGTQPSASLISGLSDERGIPSTPATMVAGRVSFETDVITSQLVDGIIVRPAVFYGRGGGGWWGSVFEKATVAGEKGEAFETTILEDGRFSLCHVDDIADLVRRVAESSPICKGLVFDCSNPITEPQSVIFDKLALLAGAKGRKNNVATNVYEEALASSHTMRPGFGRALLGWEARKPGFTDALDLYYAAWKAGRRE